jgi:arylsulfatase A-like enzyme
MTGRYNYRTGVVDTWVGQALLRPNEVTAAQIFGKAGYRTGIFGKWHLGDNFPLRPMDRGFQETLIHHDGAIGSIPDPPYNQYQDPILFKNDLPQQQHGYCTNVFFDAATQFMQTSRSQPFFVYLPVNVPHIPLQIADSYVEPYRRAGISEQTARLYGTMTNFDENVGRLLQFLRESRLEENTILIYMSDNGPAGEERYNAGLRGGKGGLHEGGTKVPFFVRWPAKLKGGVDVDRIGAHIDVLPTLLDLCGIPDPPNTAFDGRSLRPLLEGRVAGWPDRDLFFQQSRPDREGIDEPRLFTNAAVRSQRFRLVMTAGHGEDIYAKSVAESETQLYDIENDPGESHDVAAQNPNIVKELRGKYEAWFHDVAKGLAPSVRIVLGSSRQNPSTLTTQDLRGPNAFKAPWNYVQVRKFLHSEPDGQGYWNVELAKAGLYEFTLRLGPVERDDTPFLRSGHGSVRLGELLFDAPIPENAKSVTLRKHLPAGPARLTAELSGQRSDGRNISAFFVDVRCINS